MEFVEMDILKFPRRRYRSWKIRNQFDKPLLILAFDVLFFLAKVFLIACLVYGFWIYATKPKVDSSSAELSVQQSAESSRVVSANAVSTVALVNSQPAIKPVNEKQEEPKANNLVGPTWIAKQKSQKYTIQYIASTEYNELEEFLPIISADEPSAIYAFKLTKEGKPMLGVAIGVFDTLESARNKLSSLPADATIQDPWIRQFKNLQRDVRVTKQPEIIAAMLGEPKPQ